MVSELQDGARDEKRDTGGARGREVVRIRPGQDRIRIGEVLPGVIVQQRDLTRKSSLAGCDISISRFLRVGSSEGEGFRRISAA